ncbi:MAG: hypothetical protein PHO56_05405 [Patescibacteria group bacterium]|nr:hypothetical protein [Patescibacteria group bacterium]
MKKGKKLALGLGLILICFLIPVFFAQAAGSEISLKITPSILEKLVKPGDILAQQIKLANQSDQEITFYAYLKDFKAAADDETGKAQLIVPGSEPGNYVSSWVDISTDGIKLAPGQEQAIPYTINVPSNVGPGGYYGAIVFGTVAPKAKPGETDKGASIGVAEQAASLLLLQIAGIADERAEIREFKTDKLFYATPFTVDFSTKIQNFGNVHVKPMGVIEISNMLGKKVAALPVNDKGGNILPKSARLFTNTWKDSFGFGRYEAALILSYGTPAESGGEGKKTLTMFWYFWIFPVKILVSAGISLLILALLFIIFLRIYRKMAVKSALKKMGVRGGQILKKKKSSRTRNEFILSFLILSGIAAAAIAILYFILF